MDVKNQKSLMIFSFNKFYSEAVTQICYAEKESMHNEIERDHGSAPFENDYLWTCFAHGSRLYLTVTWITVANQSNVLRFFQVGS